MSTKVQVSTMLSSCVASHETWLSMCIAEPSSSQELAEQRSLLQSWAVLFEDNAKPILQADSQVQGKSAKVVTSVNQKQPALCAQH